MTTKTNYDNFGFERTGINENLVQDALDHYYPETIGFLYKGRFVKRNRTMKMSSQITAYREDLVLRELIGTASNGLKTFFTINTGLLRYYRNAHTFKPLSAPALAKARLKDIFFTYSNFIYHTANLFLIRNVRKLVFRRKNHMRLPSFNKYARPLNKLFFYTLFDHLQKFSFKTPIYITKKRRRNSKLKVRYLGFRLNFKNRYNRRRSLFKTKAAYRLKKHHYFRYKRKQKKNTLRFKKLKLYIHHKRTRQVSKRLKRSSIKYHLKYKRKKLTFVSHFKRKKIIGQRETFAMYEPKKLLRSSRRKLIREKNKLKFNRPNKGVFKTSLLFKHKLYNLYRLKRSSKRRKGVFKIKRKLSKVIAGFNKRPKKLLKTIKPRFNQNKKCRFLGLKLFIKTLRKKKLTSTKAL